MRASPVVRAAIAAAALLVAACSKPAPPPDTVRPVQLVQVALGSGADTAVFAGEVKPRYETDLGFRIGGKIVERRVDTGARVRRGEVLARLDPMDVGLQAQAAKAALTAAETDLRFAQSELERYRSLHAQKFVSASALDAKKSAYDSAKARAEQARAQQDVAQNQTGYATLGATDDGVITAVAAESGQVVTAGQVVMRLAREAEREVAISIPESRIGEVRDAKSLVVRLWAKPDKLYPARVREIAPAVDPVTRTFAVRVSVLQPDAALQWGMTANVGVIGSAARDVALLPLPSIYHQPDGSPAVWVFEPATGKVALRSVTLGPFREDGAVITKGLANGEWVVAAGVNKLQPGQVVRRYEAGAGTATASARSADGTPKP
jgi:multidrug efflux system membrane fusion protein